MMEIIIQVLAAAVGTIAFSVLFSVPKRYYGFCGICGGAGWLVYALLVPSLSVPVAKMCIRDRHLEILPATAAVP